MIYTSYFANVKNILVKKSNIRFCSIAGKTPQWFIDLDKQLNLKSFKCSDLAPKYSWWNVWHTKFIDNLESQESKDWYISKYYETVLLELSVDTLVNNLKAMSDNNDICLLCYETPEKFCHRHIVAEWLNKNKIECVEI